MVNSGSFDEHGSEGELVKAEFTKLEEETTVTVPRTAASPHHLVGACATEANFTAVVPDGETRCSSHDTSKSSTLETEKEEHHQDLSIPERDDGLKETITSYLDLKLVAEKTQTTIDLPEGSNAKSSEVVTKTSLQCSVPLDKVKNVLELYKRNSDKTNFFILESYLMQNIKPSEPMTPELTTNTAEIVELISDSSSQKPAMKRLLCLFCERTFTSNNLRQKHVDRCHSVGQSRRSSSRIPNQNQSATACCFCSKLNHTDHTLKQLLEHLINEHSNRYFACLACQERFANLHSLREHNRLVHGILLQQETDYHKLPPTSVTNCTVSRDSESVRPCTQTELNRTVVSDLIAKSDSTQSSSTHVNSSLNILTKPKRNTTIKNTTTPPETSKNETILLQHEGVDFEENILANVISSESIKKNIEVESELEDLNLSTRRAKTTVTAMNLDKKNSSKKPTVINKKLSVKSTKIGVRSNLRTTRATVKQMNTFTKNRNKSKLVQSDSGGAQIVATKKLVANPTSVFSLVNAYTYKFEKIYDHSSDSIKDSNSVAFNAVFDKEFYTRTVCNIRDNLLHHLDGKLNSNVESESRISNFEHNPTCVPDTDVRTINDALDNFGCDLSLNAVTPVATLLASSQYGEDFDSQIEYGAKASQKKAKKAAVVKYKFTNKKYNSLFREKDCHTDLTYLDMWTQFTVKNSQHKCHDCEPFDQHSILPIYSLNPIAKDQVDELNRIMDKRGPFEDLRLEADAAQRFELRKKSKETDSSSSDESSKEICFILEELLTQVEHKCNDILKMEKTDPDSESFLDNLMLRRVESKPKEEVDQNTDIPDYLQLQRTLSTPDFIPIDETDKIALICSSLDDNSVPVNKALELSGEWTRPRIYICATCGLKLPNLKALDDHKNFDHPNIWGTHYEFVGNQAKLYRHLSIPGLGKVGLVECSPTNKFWQRSDARVCTKCTKQCHSLGDLHRHMLECGGDWTWMLARKKCKYRPYGARSRRRRQRGYKRSCNPEIPREPRKYKTKNNFIGPRPKPTKPSDAETIERMLANLPPKRNRKAISMRDGIQKPRKPYKQRLVSQTTPNNPQSDPPPSVSPKKVHFKINSPQITTKQTLRNVIKQKISVLKKPNIISKTEHLDTPLKLRSRLNKKDESEIKINVNKDETEQIIGKNKIRQSRMISRILGSKIFDTNSAIVTRRRLVKAITQNNLIRKTRLRSKNVETNAQLSSNQKIDEQSAEENVEKLTIDKNKNTSPDNIRKGRNRLGKQQNTEESEKILIPDAVSVKASEPENKILKRSSSKRFMSVLTKTNNNNNNNKAKEDKKEAASEKKMDTISVVINDVVKMSDIVVGNTSDIKNIEMATDNKRSIRKTRSLDRINRIDETQEDNLKGESIKIVDDIVKNNKKSNNVGKIFGRKTNKLVQNLKSLNRRNKLKSLENENKDNKSIASKLLRTFSIRDSKNKKTVKINELKEEANAINDTKVESVNNVDNIISSVIENIPITVQEIKSSKVVETSTMPILEKFDSTSNIPTDTIPDLSPITEIETNIKLDEIHQNDVISDPEKTNTDAADLNINDNDKNKLLNKFKSKIKRSGRGLNDCIAMLRGKLEQKCQNTDPSFVDKSSLFILNSSEMIKHSQLIEAEQNESVLSNSVESITDIPVTVKEMNKLCDKMTDADNSIEIMENIDSPIKNNKSEKCTKISNAETPTLNINVNVLEIPTVKCHGNSITNNVTTNKLQESNNGYITPNIQLSYVLNATLKNCLMECVKNKCEELKIESQNVTLEKLNRINKDRKIGSIRKRAKKKNNTNLVEKHIANVHNTSEIEKAVTNAHNNINVTEKHIPNVPVLLNTAFVETPVELNKTDIPITKQLMDESSDEDVPLSKLIGPATTLPSTKLNVKLPAAKKKRKQKKKIAFTPLILNNQDTCVSQVNLQENVTLDYSKHNQIEQIQDDIAILKDIHFEETSEDICEEEFLSNNEISEEEIQSKGENKIEENLENIESIKPDEDKIIISDEEPLTNYLVTDEQMYAKEASLEQTEIVENFERIESNRPDNEEKVHICEEDPLLNSNISEDSIKGTSLYMLVFPRSNNQFKEVAINKKTEITTENKIDTISTVINEVVKMFSIEEEPPLEEIETQVVKLVEIKKLWEGQEHLNKDILREIEIEDAVVEAPKILVEEATSSVISPIQEKEESQESTSVTKNLIKDIIEVFNPLSHHIMTVEDEPCDVHLLNKTLTEANIEPTITVKIVENSEILNKTAHVDSGKENSEEKSLYQRIKKQRKTAKKNKNKRKPRSVKIISQIENVKPSNSRSEDNLDESCIISSDNTSEKINDEHVIHFKCNLQFETEPDSIVMENKEIIGTSLKENLEMKPLEHSILSSDSEDELPLALLIKQRNQNVDLELIKDSHEFGENEISVKIDNEYSESATTISKTDCFNNIESVDLIVPSVEKPVDLFETDLNEFDDIVQDNSVIIKSLSEENLSLNVEEILTRIDEDSKDICNLHCLEENILQVAEDPIVNLSNIKTLEVDVIKDTLNLENTTGLNADFEVPTEVNEDLLQFSKPGIAEILEDQDKTFKGNIRVENITYQETLMKTPVATQKSNEDPFNFLKTPIDTPVLINNSDFITTPDLADPLLVLNIEKKLKVKYRKSKKSRKRVIPKSSNKNNIRRKEEDLNTIHICDICNKIFKRKETLTSHKRTLTHIAKLSEIEAWESSAKRSAEANNDIQSIQESSTDLNNKEVELLVETNLKTIDETSEDNIELNDIEVTSPEKNIHNSEALTEEIIHNSEPAVEEMIHKPEHAIEEFKNDNESSEVIKIQKSESLQIEIDIPNYPETCIDEYKIHESETVKIETEMQNGLEISNENEVLFMEDIKQHAIELPDLIIDDENSIDSDQHLGSENLVIDEEEDIEEIVMNSVPSFVPGIIVNSTNRNLKLVDIINEVLDKPVMDLSIRKIEYQPNKSPKRNDSVDKYAEPKRYKSVGERKSFDSDNVSLPQKSDDETPAVDNYNPINLIVNNGILSKQLSILENIMEDPSKINYIDDSISISSREFDEPLVEQTMPDKDIFRSVESMTKLKDPTIKFSHNSDVLNSFIKPNFTNFQNISETINKSITHQYEEVSQVNFEEQPEIRKARKENSTRKILNRDEELFLECCSLLKSSSEITGMSKKSTKHIPLNNFSQSNDTNWMQKQAVSNRYIQRDSYSWLAQSSRVNTPIGEPFVNNDWSNSNSAVSSEWMAQKAQSPDRPTENNTFLKKCNNNSEEIKYSDIQFEDISVDSSMEASKTLMAADSSNTENIPLDFHNVDFFDSNRNKDINTDDEDASYLEIALDEDSENVSYKTDENEFTTEKDHLVDEQEQEIEEKFDVDLKKKVITAFGGLMARAMGNRLHAAVKKNKRSRSKRESNSQQSSIIDYTVPLKKNKLEPVDSDSSDGPKKVITKGAMKVFEGIKVSIPTQDLNLQEVLNVAKKLEVNEIESKSEQIKLNHMEEFQSNTIKEKSQNHKNGKLKKLFGRFGNKLGLRATKKKQSKHRSSAKAQSTIDKSHDVYDFEESCDNFTFKNGTFPLFRSSRDNTSEKSESDFSAPKCTINKKNGAKSTLENDNIVESLKWNIESDSDTDRYYDSMSFEEVSVSSDTTRGCSTLNDKIKPMVKRNSEKSKDNQKKCMIMGRIFKNASKPKLEDKIPEIRDFSSEDNSKLVEPFLDSCSSIDNVDTNVPLLPSPNNLTVINSANKMSKIEMDLLFDKLLESEKKNSEAQLAAKINKEAVDAIATDESHLEKNKKCKDVKAKSSKSKKRHRHNSGESRSSDEYTLYGRHTKSSKKHHKTPRKPSKPKKESGFNLEQEMKECIGVAGRKSQRKCTSGKQNVLIESWSSDESSFEDEIPQVVTEPEMIPEDQQQNIEEDSNPDQIDTLSNSCNSVTLEMCKPVVSEEKNLNFDVYEFDSDMETKNVDLPKTIDAQEFINVNKIKIPRRSVKSKIARSRKHSKTHLALNEIEYESEKSKKRAEHRRRRMLEHGMSESNITDSLAVTRKKRNAGDMLYYWSSSSDDEFQDLIEVKPIREDTDDDRPMQHGWIVGESPKKLVTLLAQAKGKKIDGESVKEQGKKNRVTL